MPDTFRLKPIQPQTVKHDTTLYNYLLSSGIDVLITISQESQQFSWVNDLQEEFNHQPRFLYQYLADQDGQTNVGGGHFRHADHLTVLVTPTLI